VSIDCGMTHRRNIMDDLILMSAATIAKAILTRQVSSAEVVEAYLWRIEAVNQKLNAIVQLAA